MKVFISESVNVSIEEIKQGLTFSDYKEMADYFSYQDDFKDEMIEAIGLDESDHLDNISDDYMNSYIKDNVAHYDVTSTMQKRIKELEHQLSEITEPKSVSVPGNPIDAHRFFCDLFGLGYHAGSTEIISKISDCIK